VSRTVKYILLGAASGILAGVAAVMLPIWAGPEGPAGMAPGMTSSSGATPGAQHTGASLAGFRPENTGHGSVT
jgi:hypothetical protein